MGKATEEQAQEYREAYWAERDRTDHKSWDDLSDEKKQRWLDKANGED